MLDFVKASFCHELKLEIYNFATETFRVIWSKILIRFYFILKI